MSKGVKYLIYVSIAAFIAACGTTTYTLAPAENDLSKLKKDYPNVTVADLQQGFTLYKMNCGGCHTLHLPNEKTREQWAKLLPEMFQKTSLSAEDQLRITQYLFVKSSPSANPVARTAY